ncbi:hypothetical protein NDU88_006658 [Pleurodeles waltl]|uniref:Uncharacterized protein n=1 Tax=Pleurodeles waltl TaxID=8319 RepID=A0AAV7LVH8_PLEWA|nr:hypothetical protein NDU88_006658 [Pleurodeles waltl]
MSLFHSPLQSEFNSDSGRYERTSIGSRPGLGSTTIIASLSGAPGCRPHAVLRPPGPAAARAELRPHSHLGTNTRRPQPRASRDRPAGGAPPVRRASFVPRTSGRFSVVRDDSSLLVRSLVHSPAGALSPPPPTPPNRRDAVTGSSRLRSRSPPDAAGTFNEPPVPGPIDLRRQQTDPLLPPRLHRPRARTTILAP